MGQPLLTRRAPNSLVSRVCEICGSSKLFWFRPRVGFGFPLILGCPWAVREREIRHNRWMSYALSAFADAKRAESRMADLRLVTIESVAELAPVADRWDDLWQASEAVLPTLRADLLALWVEQFAPCREAAHARRRAGRPIHCCHPVAQPAPDAGLGSGRNDRQPVDAGGRSTSRSRGRLAGRARFDRGPDAAVAVDHGPFSSHRPAARSLATLVRRGARSPRCGPLPARPLCHSDAANFRRLVGLCGRTFEQSQETDEPRGSQSEPGGGVELRIVRDLQRSDVESWLRRGFEVEDRNWKGQAGSSVLKVPGIFDYFVAQARNWPPGDN